MSTDEQNPVVSNDDGGAAKESLIAEGETGFINQEHAMKLLEAKELYCYGSRNFLIKNYSDAADQLSQACAHYEELYGEQSNELGMPYLLYAKSLIALALDENKVIDVPDEEELDDDDDDDDDEDEDADEVAVAKNGSGNGAAAAATSSTSKSNKEKSDEMEADSTAKAPLAATPVLDDEKPSTSNGDASGDDIADVDNDAASNLQLAWEILELADKIFSRQGGDGMSNLAEVRTELANIEFENNLPEAARDDYMKALKIYCEMPPNYRRAMAEIHYKIGLTYLMQQMNKEGAESLKAACELIDGEIKEIQECDEELSEKRKSKIQDLEETKQEIWAKISEIEETQAQNVAEVRAALDSYIKPINSASTESNGAGSSTVAGSTSAASASSSSAAKPTDISHLIKRKKPNDNTEAEVGASPAKRPAA
ncbi:nuclear autoantigenic sperm protein homolog [Bactrocera oleae]|uniref:nuclear autoantigenic sperm protein homolog n=1 Tax=Bactrocera oleae TaxID=104688 RepID=UPI00387EAA62